MLLVCAVGVLVMSASIFGFRAARQHWFEQDELMKLTANEPGITTYEYRITRQMRGELLEMLGEKR